MSKPKIAICVSGQTRGFNDRSDRFYESIDDIFQDFDYDLFGHTWTDQEIDQSHYDIFKQIIKTPQEEIWKELNKRPLNPFSFFLLTDEIRDSAEYQLAMSGQGNLADLMNQVITGCYSQLVSGAQAISLAPLGEYQAYVKYRWDISKTVDDIDLVEWRKQFYEWVINNNNRNAVLEQYDCHSVQRTLFYDMMITFSTEARGKFRTWPMLLDDMFINPKYSRLIPESSHDLWKNFCTHIESEVSIMTTQVPFGFAYDPVLVHPHKTNKKWGI